MFQSSVPRTEHRNEDTATVLAITLRKVSILSAQDRALQLYGATAWRTRPYVSILSAQDRALQSTACRDY